MPRLGKVLTSARGKCPWWDHTIPLLHCRSMLCPYTSAYIYAMPNQHIIAPCHYRDTYSILPLSHTPLASLPLSYPIPILILIQLIFLLNLLLFLSSFSLPPPPTPLPPPTLCLCSCVVRRNEVVTHNQPRPTPCYIYIHSYYPPTHPLCKDTHARMHPCIYT